MVCWVDCATSSKEHRQLGHTPLLLGTTRTLQCGHFFNSIDHTSNEFPSENTLSRLEPRRTHHRVGASCCGTTALTKPRRVNAPVIPDQFAALVQRLDLPDTRRLDQPKQMAVPCCLLRRHASYRVSHTPFSIHSSDSVSMAARISSTAVSDKPSALLMPRQGAIAISSS